MVHPMPEAAGQHLTAPSTVADGPDAAGSLSPYLQAANFLAAAQVYLRDNCLLGEPLRPEHLKPRLLGHWGTCPGINAVYAGVNRLILGRNVDALLVTGPGHGAAANLANLWLEGSLEAVDPRYSRDRTGLFRLVGGFSWPDGFPSHLGPMVPGVIHEGGELGYALATAFGAAFDNPELLVACIVGDGEAETGPTATAWHSSKFLDPVGAGAVLPILHLNGYKISSPTIFGTMDDTELTALFEGYGWHPRIVAGPGIETALDKALEWAHDEIAAVQSAARAGRRPERPRWPMIVLRSPKGWTGISELDGVPVEGSFRSHQVPAKDAAGNPAHLARLEEWLRSYRPAELFDEFGRPASEVLADCPDPGRRMGTSPHANGGRVRSALRLPELESHATDVPAPGGASASALAHAGGYLGGVVRANADACNFRIVSPDELVSNRLEAILEATSRAYQWPVSPWDEAISPDGRVMEVLSEHNCQGWLQGYLLTGRHGVFPCYEAFISIVDGMANQYAKFLKVAREVPWREPVASLNYLLTSEGWRQEHNGYSHQGPGFINLLLDKKESVVRVYLPPDANCLLVTLEHCLQTTDCINLIVASKQPLPQWSSLAEARAHCRSGASTWEWASTGDASDPDVVLAAAGAIPTVETLAAAQLLAVDAPELRVRVVNVCDLLVLMHHRDHPHGMSPEEFETLFTADRPVIFDFHGYPSAIHQLVHHRPEPERFHVKGYDEEGTTTTPFDLLVMNGVSRYQLAIEALRRAPGWSSRAGEAIRSYEEQLITHRAYIVEHGEDPPEIANWAWGDSHGAASPAAP
jgi:xylulose-5-phosphate/fructose-6-phosphate phosphoketolase